jgi:hypothetical protein
MVAQYAKESRRQRLLPNICPTAIGAGAQNEG